MISRHTTILGVSASFVLTTAAVFALSLPADDWNIAGPFGGTATAVAVDPKNPKILLAGARNSLLFQSDNSGETWNMLNLPKRTFGEVTSILVDPSDSSHYLVAMIGTDHAGVFESVDAGKTWTPTKDVQDVGVRALAFAPSDPTHFVAGTLRGVMFSSDSGKSWTRISDPENLEMQGITAVAFDPKDANTIYAGTTHLPWRTKDGGKTWESIHTGMIDDSDVFSIYVDPGAPDNIFASACSGIYSSANRGDMWRKLLGIPNTHRRTHVIREDPTQAGTVYAGTTLGLFKSVNQGTTWRSLNFHQVNALTFDPSQPKTMYVAMEYQGVGKSDDSGETIRPMNKGFIDRHINSITTAGENLVAVETQEGDTTGIFSSKDRGDSWQETNSKGLEGVHLRAIAGTPGEDRILLAAASRQMYKSIDAGMTWKPIPIRLMITSKPKPVQAAARRASNGKGKIAARPVRPVKPIITIKEAAASDITGIYAAKSGTKVLVFATTDLGLLKSGDMGERWTLAELPGSTAANELYGSQLTDGRLIVKAPGGLYFSKDFGENWAQVFFPLPMSEVNEAALGCDVASPIIVATRSGLYSSSDGGNKWVKSVTGIPASTVNSVTYSQVQPSVAYAVAFGQLYQSNDSGTSWASVPSVIPSLHIRQLWCPSKSSGRLYAITNDLGILFRNEAIIR